MPDLDSLKEFETDNANVVLWVFKKHVKDGVPKYTGRWINTSDQLKTILRTTFSSEVEKIDETVDYSLLAQNNEASVLTIEVRETLADRILVASSEEDQRAKIENVKHINNAAFYVAKFVMGDNVVYGIKRPDTSWKTRKNLNLTSVIFSDASLDVNSSPAFNIASNFDFLIFDDCIYIKSKGVFEMLLHYKAAHEDDFGELCREQEFSDVFTDLAAIEAYVGDNKMQLRRASAIRQKGHYKDANFLSNLRDRHEDYGLTINFDQNGKIIPDEATSRDIFIALLDHRLASAFSENIYDVQDTSPIEV